VRAFGDVNLTSYNSNINLTAIGVTFNSVPVFFAPSPCYGTAVMDSALPLTVISTSNVSVPWFSLVNSSNATLSGLTNEIINVSNGVYSVDWTVNIETSSSSAVLQEIAVTLFMTDGTTPVVQPGGAFVTGSFDPTVFPRGIAQSLSGHSTVAVTGSNIGFYLEVYVLTPNNPGVVDCTFMSGFPLSATVNQTSLSFHRIN
jgi:hypothetical protein